MQHLSETGGRIMKSLKPCVFLGLLASEVMNHEGLIVIPSHDDILLKDLTAKQLIGGELALQ
jgi:hypothetical protein